MLMYKKMSSALSISYMLIIAWIGSMIAFQQTNEKNAGALPYTIYQVGGVNQLNSVSFEYVDEVYMKPYFWISSYVIGVVLGLAFTRYASDLKNGVSSEEASRSTRLFNYFARNNKMRYFLIGPRTSAAGRAPGGAQRAGRGTRR